VIGFAAAFARRRSRTTTRQPATGPKSERAPRRATAVALDRPCADSGRPWIAFADGSPIQIKKAAAARLGGGGKYAVDAEAHPTSRLCREPSTEGDRREGALFSATRPQANWTDDSQASPVTAKPAATMRQSAASAAASSSALRGASAAMRASVFMAAILVCSNGVP